MRAAIMDSSPQPAPPATVRRPLKRTASTASLPTPSYTRERRKKQRRSSSDTDDEQESPTTAKVSAKGTAASSSNRQAVGTSSDSSDGEMSTILKVKAERLGLVKATTVTKTKTVTVTVQAPLSPPRSTRSTTRRASAKVEIPTTPPPRRSPRSKPKSTLLATRDSPNNPFLVSDKNPVKRLPRMTSVEREEKPTMTYVFRGVKGTFENPLFRLPEHHRQRAKLPLEHPDFSPDPVLPPRRLFVSQKELEVVSEDEEEEELKLKPKRLFATTSTRVVQ
ncbi:hypothetical protein BKA62DRAFT_690799 [Auriculariales sp. MPI-PUGE-AT-0066]|nr:hypothetical protein BKA62DRAFT_690799 [Auriculariales sp. MPI-PUGE-AT-0066]